MLHNNFYYLKKYIYGLLRANKFHTHMGGAKKLGASDYIIKLVRRVWPKILIQDDIITIYLFMYSYI